MDAQGLHVTLVEKASLRYPIRDGYDTKEIDLDDLYFGIL